MYKIFFCDVIVVYMVVSDQAFSAEAEKCLQGLERHLGVSGCLLRREPCRHCACALHPHLRAHVEKLGRIQRRCSTSRVAVASSQGEKDFGFFIFLDWTHHGGRLTARVSPGFLVGATWSWRNRSRTPSESSGATALCRKQRGPRTKVSVSPTDARCHWSLKRAGVGHRRD